MPNPFPFRIDQIGYIGPVDTSWGIDLGGTKIEGVVLERGTDRVILRHRIATEAHLGYSHIVDRICRLVDHLESTTGIARPSAVGYGTPGSTDPGNGLLKNSNTVCLNGKSLSSDLTEKTGVRAILANDANCFALAEATIGVARGYGVVFGVIMGTGVGGGLVIHGHLIDGHHGIGGEWGHNVLDPSGDPCYCGKKGCVERVISGPAVEAQYERSSGRRASLRTISQEDDDVARATISKLCSDFGRALSVVVNIVDPDAIVLGGGVGNVAELYTLGLEELRKNVFSSRFDAPLLKPMLGDSAGVFGAAMLVESAS